MIKDTLAQDVHIERDNPFKGKLTKGIVIVATVVLVGWIAIPPVSSLLNADYTVSRKNHTFAYVIRGDLQRDLAVQGRVLAAVSPTLFAATNGAVTLKVKAGDRVVKDQVLALIDSPELINLYQQALSTQEELKLAVYRQELETRSALMDNKQSLELAAVDLEVTKTKSIRATASLKSNLISKEKFEEDQALLKKAKVQYEHALQNESIEKEKLAFELRAKKIQLNRQDFVVNDLKLSLIHI